MFTTGGDAAGGGLPKKELRCLQQRQDSETKGTEAARTRIAATRGRLRTAGEREAEAEAKAAAAALAEGEISDSSVNDATTSLVIIHHLPLAVTFVAGDSPRPSRDFCAVVSAASGSPVKVYGYKPPPAIN